MKDSRMVVNFFDKKIGMALVLLVNIPAVYGFSSTFSSITNKKVGEMVQYSMDATYPSFFGPHSKYEDLILDSMSAGEIQELSLKNALHETQFLRFIEAFATRVSIMSNGIIDSFSHQWYENQKVDFENQKNLLTMKLDGLKDIFRMTGEGISTLLGDKERMMALAATIVAIIGGYYVVKHGTHITAHQIEKYLSTPKLLTETSWVNPLVKIKNTLAQFMVNLIYKKMPVTMNDQIILSPELSAHIDVLTRSTKEIHAAGAYHQNLLLYGEPGTGKTLFATLLARHADMDYAILAGPNFDQFDDQESIIQLNKLFDWAESRDKGVILFIDEAETFLGKRDTLSEKSKRLLNVFLARTGAQSKKFMLVCATNRPDMLDKAILSRLSVKVEFQKPGLDERFRLLKMYATRDLGDVPFSNDIFKDVAQKMDDFSGREIAQFITGLKAAMLITNQTKFSPLTISSVLEKFIQYHNASGTMKAFA